MRRVPKDMLWLIITLLVIGLVLTNLSRPPTATALSAVLAVTSRSAPGRCAPQLTRRQWPSARAGPPGSRARRRPRSSS